MNLRDGDTSIIWGTSIGGMPLRLLDIVSHKVARAGGSARAALRPERGGHVPIVLGWRRHPRTGSTGWSESGKWNPNAMASGDAAEVEAVGDAICSRGRGVQRVTSLR